MNPFSEKTIILGIPKLFDLDSLIEKELKAVGFKTVNISVHTNKFKYKNIFQRLESFIVKNFLGRKHYKQILNFNLSKKALLTKLQNVDKADYILIIRPEVYPIDFLKELKKKGGKMVGYQWNGLSRFPRTYDYISLFDRFFVFDGKDLDVPSVFPITNFYFTTIAKNDLIDRSDVFYAGSFYRNRIASICDLVSKCRELGLKVHCHLFSKRRKHFIPCDLSTTEESLSYEQNIQYTYNTNLLLDFKVPEHDGLSFRVLDSIGFEKKLVTTNHRVLEYDFFHPNNILVWTSQSKEELASFIKKPYVTIPEKIRQKYSFNNWIQYVLDEGYYTPIEIPR
jgi:hypothetical protein